MSRSRHLWALLLMVPTRWTLADPALPLIVVEDGGVSAFPYYRSLKLLPARADSPPSVTDKSTSAFTESTTLPVRSERLSPGLALARTIHAPGLTPLFIIGDDPRSRDWLRKHHAKLRELNAVGVAVNVESIEALESLRQLVPGLTITPAAGDDLAQRLDINHYPLLITAAAIEQ